jgi:hypothetical protein
VLTRIGLGLFAAFLLAAASPAAAGDCQGGKSSTAAMVYSILHPGVGEYYLKGWGPWRNMPPKKFWLGFIPLYGSPGYLQVKSAIDASKCRTNDDLAFRD